jgi:hypothetical protein
VAAQELSLSDLAQEILGADADRLRERLAQGRQE